MKNYMRLAVVLAVTIACQASAQVMVFNPVSVMSGTDGQFAPPIQRDGVFDQLWGGSPSASLLPNNLTDSRFALEYNISTIPANSTIVLATLTFAEIVDSPLTVIQLHGYAGDGVVDLHDMVANNLLLPDISDGNIGTTVLPVTSFITSLVNQGAPFAGFMCRDVQDTQTLLGLNYYQIGDSPTLSVSFTVVPEPSIFALLGVSAVILCASCWRIRKAKI